MNAVLNLSQREHEIADLWSSGFNAHEIADKLFIAYNTVRNHKANIIDKLDAKNAVQVALTMFRHDPNKFLNGLGLILALIILSN